MPLRYVKKRSLLLWTQETFDCGLKLSSHVKDFADPSIDYQGMLESLKYYILYFKLDRLVLTLLPIISHHI